MVTLEISALQREGIEARLSELDTEIGIKQRQREFLTQNIGSTHLTLVLEYIYRTQFRAYGTENLHDLKDDHRRQLGRLIGSLNIPEESTFEKLARVLWVLESFSRNTRDPFGYGLHGASRIEPSTGFADFSNTMGFDFTTCECPGIAETVAELGIGNTAFIAMAAGEHASLRLYGERGAERNRNLCEMDPGQRSHMYGARSRLMEILNIPVIDIDIPEEILTIPKPLAIARGMIRLGSYQRVMGEEFVGYVLKQRRWNEPDAVPRLTDIVSEYRESRKSADDYGNLKEKMQEYLIGLGTQTLQAEGINCLADAILHSARSKRTVKAYDARLGPINAKLEKLAQRESEGGDEYQRLEAEKQDIEGRQAVVKKEAAIWKAIFPGDLDLEVVTYLTSIHPHAVYEQNIDEFPEAEWDKLAYVDGAARNVEYYLGEILGIMRPLLDHSGRALVVVGNPPEQYWHELIVKGLNSPLIASDLLWAFDDAIGKGRHDAFSATTAHPGFFSVLYSHYRLPPVEMQNEVSNPRTGQTETITEVKRPMYISYGPNVSQLSEVPLLGDSEKELSDKLDRLSECDPDAIAILVVNAVYSMLNLGDNSEGARARFERNRGVLSEASLELPEAYRASISVLDPGQIPAFIDQKIQREYDTTAKRRRLADIVEGNQGFVEFALARYNTLSGAVDAAKTHVQNAFVDGIIELGGGSLEEGISLAERTLSQNYHDAYAKKARRLTSKVSPHERKAILEENIQVLATQFLRLYQVSPDRRFKDTYKMERLIADTESGTGFHRHHNFDFAVTSKRVADLLQGAAQKIGEVDQRLGSIANGKSVPYIEPLCEAIIHVSGITSELKDKSRYLGAPFRQMHPDFQVPGGFQQDIGNAIDMAQQSVGRMSRYLAGEPTDRADLVQHLNSRFTSHYGAVTERVQIMSWLYSKRGADDAIEKFMLRYTKGDLKRLGISDLEVYKGRGMVGFVSLLADISKKKDDEKKGLVEAAQQDPFPVVRSLLDSVIYPLGLDNEICLLEMIEGRLEESEQQYMDFTGRFQYANRMMFPHELQQASIFRNKIATWKGYYKQAASYLSGETDELPFNPALRTCQADSAFSISPKQGANFLSWVFAYFREELGQDYFAAQERAVRQYRSP